MSEDGVLTIFAASRAIRVASRLRTAMEAQGFGALDPGARPHPQEFGFVLRPTADRSLTCIHPEFAESVPETLTMRLSAELRCRVTSVVRAGPITAYEVWEAGERSEKLAVQDDKILEEASSPYSEEVRRGANLAALLEAAGLDGVERSFGDAKQGSGRPMLLRFAPLGRSSAAEEIEIDPLLTCPLCKSPMRVVSGAFGAFYGCVRFPGCRGRLTEKQARTARNR